MARTSRTMLNKTGESVHPYLFPDLRENAFTFPWLRMMFSAGLSYMAFIMLRYVLSTPTVWRVFIINQCWILSKVFLHLLRWSYGLYSSLCWCGITISITLSNLQILKNPCIPGINPTCSWCMVLLIYCWIQIASILLRIFASVFISDIGL